MQAYFKALWSVSKVGAERSAGMALLENRRNDWLRRTQTHFYQYRYGLIFRNPAMCPKDLIEVSVPPVHHIILNLFRERSLDLLKGHIPTANRNAPEAIALPISERLQIFHSLTASYQNRSARPVENFTREFGTSGIRDHGMGIRAVWEDLLKRPLARRRSVSGAQGVHDGGRTAFAAVASAGISTARRSLSDPLTTRFSSYTLLLKYTKGR